MSHWQEARVVGYRQWAERLFTLQVDAPAIRFTAGQFASLALPAPQGSIEPMVARPYSFVNAPGEASADAVPHEFLIVELPEGLLSPRLARLRVGDPVWIGHAYGFFVCEEIPPAETLWMLSTGTGIAPFLSILRTDEPWQKFKHIVLAHGVRFLDELVYRDVAAALQKKYGARFSYAPFVSRETVSHESTGEHSSIFTGRMTAALTAGILEKKLDRAISKEDSQVMLCGNPAMIEEVQRILGERGMKRHRKRAPGNITSETYW